MVVTENIQETLINKKIGFTNVLNIHDVNKHRDKNKEAVIITGVTGQDGSFMVDYLLKHTDCQLFGGVRRLSVQNHENIQHVNNPRFNLINFDLTDSHAISRVVENIQPSYFLNFAAQSFVAASWDFSRQTWETNTTSVLDILEAVRLYAPMCRVYNAGSSEEFGNIVYSPQDEKHPLRPRSPYAASKAAARQLIKVYRESYNLYAVQGWLFNHEGTRRGVEFVTRKITKGVARIYDAIKNKQPFDPIELGNLDSCRDWSDSEDFVDAVWRMMNQEKYRNDVADMIREYDTTARLLLPRDVNPAWHRIVVKNLRDYVIASGETHSIRDFVYFAFKAADIPGAWKGDGQDEKYITILDGGGEVNLVTINPQFYRPAEVDVLTGDSRLARKDLGWEPKVSFEGLVKKMVKHDLGQL